MKKQTGHGRLKAGVISLVFIAAWMLKVGHALVAHHAHRDAPVCEAAHQGNETHLHDARYHPDDCSMCAFLFAIPELVSIPVMVGPAGPLVKGNLPPCPAPCLTPDGDPAASRGPPRS